MNKFPLLYMLRDDLNSVHTANSLKDLPVGDDFRIVGKPPVPHKSIKEGVEEIFFQIREPHVDGNGRQYKAATVFARQDAHTGGWRMTIARCSNDDAFRRSTGRSVARRRWFEFAGKPVANRPTYEDALAYYKSI